MRYLAAAGQVLLIGLFLIASASLIGSTSASAQSGGQAAQNQGKPPAPNAAEAAKENQRKTDEFVEAQQAINGPAGNPECVWLGRRVVSLIWRDDLDTAFRHLDLYDRFGCPGGHVQAAFRCLTRFGGQIDPKVAETLSSRIHACWINPAAQPQAAATARADEPRNCRQGGRPPRRRHRQPRPRPNNRVGFSPWRSSGTIGLIRR